MRPTQPAQSPWTASASPDLRLLPRQHLVKTSEVDQADWIFRPVLGRIQRSRFHLVRSLLPAHSRRLLEIGYGSGVFMPELARHATELHGIDTHPMASTVARSLRSQGVTAALAQASTSELPYDDRSFDCVVGISCLEFVDPVDRACAEIHRVLEPGGVAVIITPGTSPVLDLGLRLMTGERAEDAFQGRRQAVLPALRRHLRTQAERRFPRVPSVWLYTAFVGEREAVGPAVDKRRLSWS